MIMECCLPLLSLKLCRQNVAADENKPEQFQFQLAKFKASLAAAAAEAATRMKLSKLSGLVYSLFGLLSTRVRASTEEKATPRAVR